MFKLIMSICCMLAVLFPACGSDGSKPTVEIADGVRHVHNTGPKFASPEEAGIALEHTRTIGDLYAEDENYAFYIPEDIARDASGNLYVLDAGNYRIQKFDTDGNYLATFGRRGQGPGEFVLPVQLALRNESELFVYDRQSDRIDVLSTDGEYLRSISFESTLNTFRIRSDGTYITEGYSGFISSTPAEDRIQPLIAHRDADGNVLKTFGEMRDYGDEGTNSGANRYSFDLDGRDNVYLAFRVQNRIEKYSPEGDLLMWIDRPLNYEELVEKTTIERSGDYVSVRSGDQNRISRGIAVDPEGRIWVLTYDRQIREEERVSHTMSMSSEGGQVSISRNFDGATDLLTTDMYKFEVYDPEGALLTEIPLTHFCDALRVFGNRLYIIDNRRGHQVYEYVIADKG